MRGTRRFYMNRRSRLSFGRGKRVAPPLPLRRWLRGKSSGDWAGKSAGPLLGGNSGVTHDLLPSGCEPGTAQHDESGNHCRRKRNGGGGRGRGEPDVVEGCFETRGRRERSAVGDGVGDQGVLAGGERQRQIDRLRIG